MKRLQRQVDWNGFVLSFNTVMERFDKFLLVLRLNNMERVSADFGLRLELKLTRSETQLSKTSFKNAFWMKTACLRRKTMSDKGKGHIYSAITNTTAT